MSKVVDKWKEKELHGRYPTILVSIQVDKATPIGWLNRGNIFTETEVFMCAIQDQVIFFCQQ